MSNINTLMPSELPSSAQLIRSTIIAVLVAAVLLIVAILPAEYGLDVTGIGRILGLTQMGEIKQSLALEASKELKPTATVGSPETAAKPAAEPIATPPVASPVTQTASAPASSKPVSAPANGAPSKSDVTTMTFAPGDGKEIKLEMKKGAKVSYEWSVDRGQVNYDTHGDSENPKIKYHGYAKGRGATSDKGILAAAFDGHHGWFWRNRTKETITITLKTEGDYWTVKRFE